MISMIKFLINTIQVFILFMVLGAFVKLFFRRTILGKLVLLICKDIWLSLRLCFRIIRNVIRYGYKESKNMYEFLDKVYKNYEKSKDRNKDKDNKGTETNNKVVNGNNDNSNVINIKDYIKGGK